MCERERLPVGQPAAGAAVHGRHGGERGGAREPVVPVEHHDHVPAYIYMLVYLYILV